MADREEGGVAEGLGEVAQVRLGDGADREACRARQPQQRDIPADQVAARRRVLLHRAFLDQHLQQAMHGRPVEARMAHHVGQANAAFLPGRDHAQHGQRAPHALRAGGGGHVIGLRHLHSSPTWAFAASAQRDDLAQRRIVRPADAADRIERPRCRSCRHAAARRESGTP